MQQLLQAHKQLIRTLQESRNPSKGVPIFLRGTEANLKMVPIGSVPIPGRATVLLSNPRTWFSMHSALSAGAQKLLP